MAHVRAQEKLSIFVVYYTFCTVSHFGPLLDRHTQEHVCMLIKAPLFAHSQNQYMTCSNTLVL